jgi:hypothetical protein
MNETVLILWLLIWVIFLVMSTIEKRGVAFGFMSGFWIMFLGVYLYLDGFQVQTGMTTEGGVISFVYTDVVSPMSAGYDTLWCIPFILLGMYIMYLATTAKRYQEKPK